MQAALSLSFIFLFHTHPRFVRHFACGNVEGSTFSGNCAVTIGSDGCLRGPRQKYWFGPTGFDCILDFHAPLGMSCPFEPVGDASLPSIIKFTLFLRLLIYTKFLFVCFFLSFCLQLIHTFSIKSD